jgi:hypothetical protein
MYYLKSRRDRILAASDWAMERTIGRVGFGASQHTEERHEPRPVT